MIQAKVLKEPVPLFNHFNPEYSASYLQLLTDDQLLSQLQFAKTQRFKGWRDLSADDQKHSWYSIRRAGE